MAIKQTYLTQTIDDLKTFLETLVPKYFGSVTYTDGDNTGITCKDNNGNTIFKVTPTSATQWNWTAYADSTNHISINSAYKPLYGYTCTNGAMIILTTSSYTGFTSDIRGSIIISKTCNDVTGIIMVGASNTNWTDLYSKPNTCAWGDVTPLIDSTGYSYGPGVTNQTQTQMFPFVTHCALGEKSYFPNAFFIPVAQTRAVLGDMVVNGIHYLTNGYWAIKDE